MMDEQELEQRLHRSFTAEPPMTTPLQADLDRGRARVRRGRAVTGLASAAAVAAIAAGAVAMPFGDAEAGRTVAPAGGDTQVTPDDPTPDGPVSEATVPEDEAPGFPPGVQTGDHLETRRLIYAAAREHLDPEREHLDFSAHSLGTSSDGDRVVAVGTKMGWRAKGDDGLGMVQVAIGRGVVYGCGFQIECQPYTSADGIAAKVGGATDGSDDFFVRVEQADGDTVDVMVSPLYGNNSDTPVSSMNVTLDAAIALAADERLDIVD